MKRQSETYLRPQLNIHLNTTLACDIYQFKSRDAIFWNSRQVLDPIYFQINNRSTSQLYYVKIACHPKMLKCLKNVANGTHSCFACSLVRQQQAVQH